MKRVRQFLAAAVVLVLLAALLPCASAEGDARFDGKTWEDVTDEFLNGYGAYEIGQIGIGYYNTVTGEEHYVNGDTFITVGSVYKVPLNMVYCERIANGEMTLSTPVFGIEYETLMRGTIIDSNNDFAYTLWNAIGSYRYYRQLIAPYMGEDPDTVDVTFYENNLFTAREMITCLRNLYENPDRFPYILDTMLEAEPTNYFRRDEHRYPIAHKYGFDPEVYHTYLADSGVVYTTEPFLLVMFTDNSPAPADLLGQYTVLMCDYTEYHTMERLRAEAPGRAVETIGYPNAPEATAGTRRAAKTTAPVLDMDLRDFSMLAGVVAAMLLGLGICAKLARKIGYVMLVPAVIIMAAGMLIGRNMLLAGGGTLFETKHSSSAEAVNSFFTEIEGRNYDEALVYLSGYKSLGLAAEPDSPTDAQAREALRASYSHRITGGSVGDGNAVQTVVFTHLSYPMLQEALREETKRVLLSYSGRPDEQLYGDNFTYLPEVVAEAYSEAFQTVMGSIQSCYTDDTLELRLSDNGGSWIIQADDALINAICGR